MSILYIVVARLPAETVMLQTGKTSLQWWHSNLQSKTNFFLTHMLLDLRRKEAEQCLIRIALYPAFPRLFHTVTDKNLRRGKAGYEAIFRRQLGLC